MTSKLITAALALCLATPAFAFGHRDFGDWQEVWPPEPYAGYAIEVIEAGLLLPLEAIAAVGSSLDCARRNDCAAGVFWGIIPQDEIDAFGCLRGSLGCSIGTLSNGIIYISEDATRYAACVGLVHEVAHLLGWAGNHAGGHSSPRPCPLSDGVRP